MKSYHLARQKEVQHLLNYPMGDYPENLKENCIALIREVCEILDELPSKPWKKEPEINIDSLKLEVIDTYMFLLNICNILDMTSEEIDYLYEEKTKIVLERYNG